MFLERSNDRCLAKDYNGDILLWDIDKTYLDTKFSSWRGLLAIPFEFAIDKRTIPGAVPLLRALRRGPDRQSAVPLYFVSGSPPQLRRVIQRRMTLDGVDYDGITFKDQWRLLMYGRIGDIRTQAAYKLLALLLYWCDFPKQAKWLCFGDDAESDAETFVLFDAVCNGFRGQSLSAYLRRTGAGRQLIAEIMNLIYTLPISHNPVTRIFIHLERQSLPQYFSHRLVTPTRSYLQTALVLTMMGKIASDSITTVARELRRCGFSEAVLSDYLEDAQKRFAVPEELLELANPKF